MRDPERLTDVGAPDPELETSPIADAIDDDFDVLRQEVPGEPACLYNGQRYDNGAYVRSGAQVMRCDYGIWVPAGPADPDNP